MKSFRSTFIFALIVALVVGFALWDFFSQERQRTEEAQARKVFQVDLERVVGLRVEREPSPLILERRGDFWFSESPIQDRLEDFAVETLLRSLLEQEALDISSQARGGSEDQDLRWEDYGLDQPMAQFELTWTSGPGEGEQEPQILSAALGTVKAYDGRYYMRRGESLLLVEDAWTGLVETSLNGLREKRAWRQPEVVNQVEIQHRGQVVAGVRMNPTTGQWEYTESLGFSVEEDLVESLLQRVRGLRIGSFVAEDKDPQTLRLYSLERPEWRLALDDWVLELSSPPGSESEGESKTLFAMSSSENFVFSLSRAQAEHLKKTNLDLRHRSEPFEFELLNVTEMRLTQGEQSLQINKLGTDWVVAGAAGEAEDIEVDRKALVAFFERLNLLRADSFFPRPLRGSVKAPEDNKIELLDSEGQLVLRLSWGLPFEDVESDRQMVHLHSSQSPELMMVTASQLEELSLEGLLE